MQIKQSNEASKVLPAPTSTPALKAEKGEIHRSTTCSHTHPSKQPTGAVESSRTGVTRTYATRILERSTTIRRGPSYTETRWERQYALQAQRDLRAAQEVRVERGVEQFAVGVRGRFRILESTVGGFVGNVMTISEGLACREIVSWWSY